MKNSSSPPPPTNKNCKVPTNSSIHGLGHINITNGNSEYSFIKWLLLKPILKETNTHHEISTQTVNKLD